MYCILYYIIYNEEGPNSNELGPFRTTCIAIILGILISRSEFLKNYGLLVDFNAVNFFS